ncbi:hypothetical protein [Seonamhaeicola marinus]|uniref:Uncharacterized protein n=1 Tax=Seonamhaeicola marinus TaxID=1912246 RepID=A0A5D0HU73_9FLAO|nr:hypothetical protein [Seonamhaeicola marinus]TYA74943.1 hypothetical protein FUA24_16725 [Seonamhaeicola marinus]
MEAHKTDTKTHISDTALNFSDNRFIGILFMLAQVGHVFTRRNFGARALKLENIIFSWSAMLLIAGLANLITRLPFLGTLDFASFKLFAWIYLFLAIYHAIRAYLNARAIPHLYTRHLGDGFVYDVISKLDMPFFKQSSLRINAFAEPVVVFVIADIIGRFLAPNLGLFLKIVSIAMMVIGVFVIQKHDDLRWDQNDTIVLGQVTQHNMKDTKVSGKKHSVSKTSRSHVVRPQNNKNHRS